MRKLDILCQEKFNGNIKETIDYILDNLTGEELQMYADEFTSEEALHVSNLLYSRQVEKYGKKKVDQSIRQSVDLDMLNITKEEVKNAKVNPYKASLGKSLLKLLISSGGVIALTTIMNNFDIGTAQSTIETLAIGGASIYSSLMAMNVGVDLLKYFKFKNLKKQYNEEQQLEEQKENEGKIL